MPQHLSNPQAAITLGYWGIRGLAQPIRYLLTCAEVPFSELRLGVFQNGTLMNKEEEEKDWKKVRSTLNMPFPNLPWLIDNSASTPIELTQSNTILRYLARRFDFYGDSELERSEINLLQDKAYDFRNGIIKTAYTRYVWNRWLTVIVRASSRPFQATIQVLQGTETLGRSDQNRECPDDTKNSTHLN